jgi:c-di-GMP-binding flagellar brake protein YcgR
MSTESDNQTASDHAERRRHPRCKAKIPVELHMSGVSTPSRTNTDEISQGGCYVETTFTIAVGTRLTMKLWLDDAPMNISCVVVTCHPQFGNGFEFVNMSEEDRQRLAKFVRDNATTPEH